MGHWRSTHESLADGAPHLLDKSAILSPDLSEAVAGVADAATGQAQV